MFGIAGLITGIILIIIGVLFIYLMVGTSHGKLPAYQSQDFSITFIVMGLIFMIIGAILAFVG